MPSRVSVELDPGELSADAIYQHVKAAGLDWADKKAAYMALEDLTHTIRSQCMKDSPSKSVAAQKVDAEASGTFGDHIRRLGKARGEYLRAEVKWKTSQLLAELRRTEAATERAKMRIL